jgi:DNA polymerase-3 subunit alpha
VIAPLHNHTEASALDGLATPREIAERCQCIGCTAVGITDHGTVAGHLEFGKTMRKFDIKPIYGCELYLGTKSEFAKNERDGYHFIAGAMTNEGLRNVWRMVDAASAPENYRYVGRVNLDILRKYSEGVFATSACIASILGQCIVKEDKGDPYWWLNQFKDIYRDNFYIELHTYPGEEHEYLNSCLAQMADETGTPVVYATDAHFASPEQYDTHDAYVAMNTGESIYLDPADRKMWHPKSLYIMSEEEIRAALSYLPERVVDEAISNSAMIADQCHAERPEVKRHLAPFIPAECPWLEDKHQPKSAGEVFIDLVEEGVVERYGEDNEEAWERAAKELEVFLDAGLEHYFLQGWDFCRFCDANGIIRGPGRGSAPGALVTYALGISDVDPLHYDLVFERFWNPGRAKGFPDIDNDFPKRNRKQVRQYLMDRWGADKVRTIGTTMRLKPKAAIDKAWKVCEVTFEEKEALKKLVDRTPDIDILGPDSVGWSRDTDPGEFEGLVDGRPKYNAKSIYVMEHVGTDILDWVESQPTDRWDILIRFIELVEMICSRVSGYGVHPSGVVVADVPLADELPCMYNRSQEVQTTCFPMDAVDARMFVKQDLLGLRNLDTLADWQAQMKEQGVEVQWSGMDKQEWPEEMWKLLDEGYTRGIFQIEDGYGRQLCREFKPRSVEDLSIIVALNRPGPIRSGAPASFIKRRRGEEEVEFDHPILEPLLNRTYGWFLYQEQVINYFSALGYDLSDADAVRKMLGKKDPQAFTALIEGLGEWEGKGYLTTAATIVGEEIARKVIGGIREFAKYSFNKAHSVCYAVIGFRTLYAKWRAPAEFIIASIRTIGDDPKKAEKTAGFIGEGRRMGIEVLPPSIENSQPDISVVGKDIYFGFSNIKGIGKTAAEYLCELRQWYALDTPERLAEALDTEDEQWQRERNQAKAEGRPFKKKSPKQRFPANRIDALVQAGAFDFFIDRELTLVQKQKLEKEMLGVILTDDCAEVFARNEDEIDAYISRAELDDPIEGYEFLGTNPEPGVIVSMPGVVAGISEKTTKKDGKKMGVVTIEYEGNEAEFVVFPQAWRSHRFLWRERTPGLFTLKVSERGVHFEDGLKLN